MGGGQPKGSLTPCFAPLIESRDRLQNISPYFSNPEPMSDPTSKPTDWAKVASGLSKPITKLIEVVAEGVGTAYSPLGTVLQAKADAQAALILAEGRIEKNALLMRAAHRLAHVEATRQKNIEDVIEHAKQTLPETVEASPVDKGWIHNFFASVQDVSEDSLKAIWGGILAGEVADPGKYSLRFLQFLKTLSKEEAEWFSQLLQLCFFRQDNRGGLFINCDVLNEKVNSMFPRVDPFTHFESIGVLTGRQFYGVSQFDLKLSYTGKNYRFTPPPPPKALPGQSKPIDMIIGIVQLTSIGRQLSYLARTRQEHDANYFDGVCAALLKHEIRVQEDK